MGGEANVESRPGEGSTFWCVIPLQQGDGKAIVKPVHFSGERVLVVDDLPDSVEDAKLKLEYDLYYTKNMSLFLDVFILLDTIRIILLGGLRRSHLKGRPRFQTDTDWILVKPAVDALAKEPAASPQ